jgi:iron complex outermembrane receptor protein
VHERHFTGRRLLGVGIAAGLAFVQLNASAATTERAIEEIVVTAQKREENINEVGMSVQAATGDQLNDLRITDTADLYKVVTGFNSNVTYYGTEIYTIRGVGFQDTALASGPTVSVYVDEVPLQFAALTPGSTLDLNRVEALKGPQGTLFGQNATGGAVNYIANKPTRDFESGIDASYGRFNTIDLAGFISGPISETLSYRVAGRTIHSGGWQKNYAADLDLPPDPYWTEQGVEYDVDNKRGDKEFYTFRVALQWEPSDRFAARLTGSGFIDKGDSHQPQLSGIAPLNPTNPLRPLVAQYPLSPTNNRAASWGPCVNVSGGTPANLTGNPDPDPEGFQPGDVENLSNRLYENCEKSAKDNDFFSGVLRMDWDVGEDMTLTSLTNYAKFTRDQQLESDGTFYQDYESSQDGYSKAFFQELRLSGGIRGKGAWVAGANYEWTSTWDSFIQTYGYSSAVPTQVFTRIPLGPTNPNNKQDTKTWAVFGNVEYPVTETVSVQAGLRYTDQKRDYRGCGSDAGDGSWADISVEIQWYLQFLDGVPAEDWVSLDAGPGNCASFGPPPAYEPEPDGFTDELDEDNVSWRVGTTWEMSPGRMLYGSISKGYKSGSYPTVAAAAFYQLEPAVQEELLAYEIGTKLSLANGTVQLNGAAFYYDYTDKQILGAVADIVFGSLPALVNVPDSEVYGAELTLDWYPIDGLRIAPSVTYSKSKIKGEFRNFDPFFSFSNPDTKDFSGQAFPNAPKWYANLDAQYEWTLGSGLTMFVGANVNYQSSTHGFFIDTCQEPGVSCTSEIVQGQVDTQGTPIDHGDTDLPVNARTLLDLRAGVESGPWRVWAWGQNVTNKHYWNQVAHVNDVLLRFTGMPATYGLSVSYRFQ